MPWYSTIISLFVVGTSVFIVSHNNDTAGWILVFMLLLGFILVSGPQKFADELNTISKTMGFIP